MTRNRTVGLFLVIPLKKLWSELAEDNGFPFCDMSGEGQTLGNSASNGRTSDKNCPPQYQYWGGQKQSILKCKFTDVVSINLNNQPITRVGIWKTTT